MASAAVDLITMLDALVSETAGTDLFEGPAPELPADCVVLTHYGGEPPMDRVMGASLTAPGIEVSNVQVLVRNALMATAKTRADAYHALLDNFNGTATKKYFQITSIDGPPHSLGQDAAGRWQYVSNYRCQHSRS